MVLGETRRQAHNAWSAIVINWTLKFCWSISISDDQYQAFFGGGTNPLNLPLINWILHPLLLTLLFQILIPPFIITINRQWQDKVSIHSVVIRQWGKEGRWPDFLVVIEIQTSKRQQSHLSTAGAAMDSLAAEECDWLKKKQAEYYLKVVDFQAQVYVSAIMQIWTDAWRKATSKKNTTITVTENYHEPWPGKKKKQKTLNRYFIILNLERTEKLPWILNEYLPK